MKKSSTIILAIASLILVIISVVFIIVGAPKKDAKENEKEVSNTTTKVVGNLDFRIDDRTEMCAEVLEEIYHDSEYRYYLSCMKSSTIYLVYEDGTEITLKDAIDTKKVTIAELEAAGVSIIKHSIGD